MDAGEGTHTDTEKLAMSGFSSSRHRVESVGSIAVVSM